MVEKKYFYPPNPGKNDSKMVVKYTFRFGGQILPNPRKPAILKENPAFFSFN